MNTKIIRGTEVTRPATTPTGSSVLDHASVAPDLTSFGLRNNDGMFPSYNMLDTAVPTELCPDVPGTKEFSFADWVEGHEFAIYGGVQCKAVGLDVADMDSEIKRVFAHNEGRTVEEGLLEIFTATAGVEDLTPASDITLNVALGLLVGHAARLYAGQPTIHMPRAAASILLAAGALVERDGRFYTKTGAKVAAGGGYDPVYPGNGVWTMYATGEVYVERSGLVELSSYTIPGDGSGTGSDENGLSDNTRVALVERMYRVAVDGFIASVEGTVW